jgi:putative transposase
MNTAHSIEILCRVLKVSRSGFYEWRGRHAKVPRDYQDLKEVIKLHFIASRKTYGHRSIRIGLIEEGVRVSRKLVLRLMKEMALEAEPWKPSPYAILKEAKEALECPNLLDRDFEPRAPNRVWTSDITYIWTKEGWSYLAVVLDLFSRRVVGWSVSDRPDTSLVLSALSQALVSRFYVRGSLMFHSDQGCQYTSAQLREFLLERGIVQSMSRKGQCWDNAPTESFFKSFKQETGLRKLQLKGMKEVEWLALDWIETWYNLKRRHTFNGYKSPAVQEMKWAA